MSQTDCPSEGQLKTLLLGEAQAADDARWCEHLLHCEACLQVAASIEADDPLVERVRAGGRLAELEVDADFASLLKSASSWSDSTPNSRFSPDEATSIGADPSDLPPGDVPAGPVVLGVATDERTVVRPADAAMSALVEVGSAGGSAGHQDAAVDLGRLGSFRILSLLGRGGMGVVFLAEDVDLRRRLAIKTLKAEETSDAAAARFLREARAAAKFQHPNLVTIYSVGQVGRTPYMSMELLRGPDLDHRVRQRGTLSPREAAEAVRQGALGLQHAHSKGVIHRDVKPSNLMYGEEGVVKVLDLGVARLNYETPEDPRSPSEATRQGMLIGTLNYMAPEQALDATSVDERADVFSLGGVLHFLLTGKPPYEGVARSELVLEGLAPPMRRLPDCPAALLDVLERMIAVRRGQRYRHMGEVIAALDAVIAELSDPPPPSSRADAISSSPSADPAGQPTADRSLRRYLSSTAPAAAGVLVTAMLIAFFLATAYRPSDDKLMADGAPEGSPSESISDGMIILDMSADDVMYANFSIDGKPVLPMPIDDGKRWWVLAKPGRRALKIVKPNHQDWTGEVAVQVGRKASVAVSLVPKPGLAVPIVPPAKIVPQAQPLAAELATRALWKPGPTQGILPGIVPAPAQLKGIERWQVVPSSPVGVVRAVAYHPQKARLACASAHSIRLYEGETLEVVGYTSSRVHVATLAWDAAGKHLAAVDASNNLQIFDERLSPVCLIENGGSQGFSPFARVSWTADGRAVVYPAVGDGLVRIDEFDGARVTTRRTLQVADDPLRGAAVSPDGQRIAAGSESGRVRIWSRTGELLSSFDTEPQSAVVGWSETDWIAVITPQPIDNVRLWKPTGEPGAVKSHPRAESFEWTHDGRSFLTGGGDEVHLWTVEVDDHRVIKPDGGVTCIAVSPLPGTQIAVGAQSRLELWNSRPALIDARAGVGTRRLAWSANGGRLAVGMHPSGVGIWEGNGRVRDHLRNRLASQLTWRRDGLRLAFKEADKPGVTFWNDTSEVETLTHWAMTASPECLGLAFSPQGELTFGRGDVMANWSGPAARGTEFAAGAAPALDFGTLLDIEWRADGERLAAAVNGALALWRDDGTLLNTRPSLMHSSVLEVAWSRDGRSLVSVEPHYLQFWTSEGESMGRVEVPSGGWNSAAWGYDGTYVVGGTGDGRLVMAAPGADYPEMLEFRHHSEIVAVAADQSSPRVAALAIDGSFHVFDTTTNTVQWVGLFTSTGSVTLSPAGQILECAPPVQEREVSYVVERIDGGLDVYSPAQFQALVREGATP